MLTLDKPKISFSHSGIDIPDHNTISWRSIKNMYVKKLSEQPYMESLELVIELYPNQNIPIYGQKNEIHVFITGLNDSPRNIINELKSYHYNRYSDKYLFFDYTLDI